MDGSVIITIVVILGIVIVGGFLLYFMGDLLMSLSNKGKDSEAIKQLQEKKQKELESRVKALENGQAEGTKTILYNGAVVESYNPNEEDENVETFSDIAEELEAEEERKFDEASEQTEETEAVEEETEEEAEEEAEEDENEYDEEEASEYIRKRRQELMERLARMQETEEEEDDEALDISSEAVEEQAEETEAVEEQAEETETVEEQAEETETPVAPVIAQTNPILDNKFEAAKESDENGKNTLAATLTLEELESKLAEQQEKLKASEKELRQCKKEFLPLRRVKNTLEKDEKKLRRKEALVAKQKVVLYGVNNYSDIDEEKAKKLAEDLDLLDGLKLSVQHCEEVMAKNEERYPLLEKIYNLLTAQNEETKEDILKLQEAINELKASSDTDAE